MTETFIHKKLAIPCPDMQTITNRLKHTKPDRLTILNHQPQH
jgi:hypothetical protein